MTEGRKMCMVSLYVLVCIFIWGIADSAWLGGTHLKKKNYK